MEIPLVPQPMLAIGWSRLARAGDILDVVAADRDEGGDPLRAQCGDDAGGAATPVIAGESRAFDAERVEKLQEVTAECRLLARSRRPRVEKPGRPVTAEIGDEYSPARGGERWGYPVIGPHVMGKAVQQDDRRTRRRPDFLIGNFERRRAEGLHSGVQIGSPPLCRGAD